MVLRHSLALIALLFSALVLAGPPAYVDVVQAPAWRVRGDVAEALQPGMSIAGGDTVKTGVGSRVYLKLPEGSTVKLGESALMTFTAPTATQAVYRAALDVVAGAFRFTTSALAKLRKREVSIHVGTATIGIRGTDVWGRSRPDEDLVMLIEGHVDVKAADGTAFDLTEPLATYLAPRDRAPRSLVMASQEDLVSRAAETEIFSGTSALSIGGAWSLRLGGPGSEAQALALLDKARVAGYPARVRPQASGDGWSYVVLIGGYASAARARSAAAVVAQVLGVEAVATR